jgi:hypothetical protein
LHESTTKPWGIFDEVPGQKFHDFEDVRKTIVVLTDKVAG